MLTSLRTCLSTRCHRHRRRRHRHRRRRRRHGRRRRRHRHRLRCLLSGTCFRFQTK